MSHMMKIASRNESRNGTECEINETRKPLGLGATHKLTNIQFVISYSAVGTLDMPLAVPRTSTDVDYTNARAHLTRNKKEC